MAMMRFPPGFRFHPTDEELVMYYLKRKNMGKKLLSEAISELNIYKFGPWDLPDKSIMRSGDREWYFFCPREKKSPNGVRTNRATENGFWKATGNDRPVIYDGRTVGMIKTLIFHLGHSPKGERTDWVMHEYRLEDRNLADAGVVQDAYMLCRIFQKSGPGPKNGAQYGAPFHEEEWSDVEETGPESYSRTDGQVQSIPERLCNWSMSKPCPSTVGPLGINTTLFDMDGPPEEDIADELAMFKEDCNLLPIEYNPNEKFETVNNDTSIEGGPYSYDLDIYNNGLGGLNNSAEPREAGFNFSTTQDNPTYLELNDFNSSAALPDGSQWLRQNLEAQGKKFQTFNSEKSTDDLPCSNVLDIFGLGTHNNLVEPTEAGFNFFATQDAGYSLSPMFLGDNNTAFFELDDLDTSLKSPATLPEGSQDHNLEALRKENGSFEADGFNACTCNETHIPCTQQEENIIDDHIHDLGELLSRSGSSIHFKAEVALKVDECTDDALSFRLEESTCMPVQDLVIKVDPFCHLGITSYRIWIFMLLLVDMIAGLFLCDIIAAFKLLHSPSVPMLKMHF